jgi:hypothetical protein
MKKPQGEIESSPGHCYYTFFLIIRNLPALGTGKICTVPSAVSDLAQSGFMADYLPLKDESNRNIR